MASRVRIRIAALAAAGAALAVALPGAPPAHAAGDPLLPEQWALSDPAAIGAPEAWTQSRGDGVVVAVLDSGIQRDHPDLAPNLWTNPDELPGNGVDDDANGYVDDINGANVVRSDGSVDDDEGHGTHVAGIVAARGDNGRGGSGVAPNARIMAVKVLDASRNGNSSLLARGIRYAVDEGARILNVSLNGDHTTPQLDEALRYAGQRGATVVASAGNNARNLDLLPSFPAASGEPAVVSVTAADQRWSLLGFANRGLRSVDLAAPGESILSTALGSRYELRAGTSMAAPHVAGALALLAGARPDMAQGQLRDALVASAPRRGVLSGLLAAGGLDVGAAMHAVRPGALWQATAVVPQAQAPTLRLRTGAPVRVGRRATVRWSISGDPAVRRWRVLLNGRRVATLGSTRARRVSRRMVRAGRHRWKVVGVDGRGQRVVLAARSFRVLRAVRR